MKKIIALLLLVFICLSLVACGNKAEPPNTSNDFTQSEELDNESTSDLNTGNKENLNSIETIAISINNWQDYFEIRICAKPRTNDFNEVDSLWISAYLVLKDEFADRYVSSAGAVEVKKSGQNATAVEYNLETKELTLVPSDNISTREWTTTVSLARYQEIGLDLDIGMGTNPDTLKQSNNVITAVSQFYKFIEITRIEGTLCLTK